MELIDFLRETQVEVRTEIGERMGGSDTDYPYPELVFAEVVMQHMSEIGMTFDPVVCHYSAKYGNANLRLSGYAVSDEADQIDLFVSLYSGVDDLMAVSDSETKMAAEQCMRFLSKCAEGRLAGTMDESTDAYVLAATIQECYPNLDQIRIYVLTDRQARSKNFKPREIVGKTVKLEVMDIERLYRHRSEGKQRDEIVVNFEEVSGMALPCIYVPGENDDYDYAMTVFPGEALRFVYEKYGARLLEANVRSFLSTTGKVNKGIRETLKDDPERFMAYNNGIVVIADEIKLGRSPDGAPGVLWLKGMQIVNGGQTTACIYFTKKKSPDTDLSRVRVPVKIIIPHLTLDSVAEDTLISTISRFANSQNAVRQADLSANKPFHVEIEKLANTTYCPDGISRWFYERAAGSYNVMLARDGTTPAKLRQIKESIPSSRKLTKTDLAKYLNTWDQLPHFVSLGSQKNFIEFMKALEDREGQSSIEMPDVVFYKQMIAKAIFFRTAQKFLRPMFPAFQGNVTVYLVSLVANRVGERLDLERIWQKQNLSYQLKEQLMTWAHEVNAVLHNSASGRMISEWAKKVECWTAVKSSTYSEFRTDAPEVRPTT